MKIIKDGQGKYEVDLTGTKITIHDKEVAGFNFVQHLFNPDMVSKISNGQWDFMGEKNGWFQKESR